MSGRPEEKYTEEEARERTETALRAAFRTPHKTYDESKVGKAKELTKAEQASLRREMQEAGALGRKAFSKKAARGKK